MTATKAGLRYDDVEVGQELPGLEFPLTRTMIVSTAIASRDYQDVHHDPGLAQERGSKDIFMNILTTNGLVGRYVTDWAGPNAVLKAVKIRLGAPNYPGDTMVMSGAVTKKEDGVVEVSIRGANSLGDHVSGTVVLELHDPPISWGAVGAKTASNTASKTASKTAATTAAKPEKQGKKRDKKHKKGKKGKA